MSKLGYEEILVRWVNYHIKRNGGDRTVKNVGGDMADGYGYGHILRNVAPSLPPNYFDLDKDARAVKVIDTCRAEGIHPPINPSDITSGNPRLNTLLLAEIFNNRHGLVIEQEKIVELPAEPETDESREIRVFKNWINSQGIEEVYVNYLIDDLKSGTILLKVIDRLRPGLVDWKKHSNKAGSRIHIIQNCNYVVDICRDQLQAKLVGIGGVDIVDGKTTLVLGLVWQICKLYWAERVGVINDEKLLAWANERVPEEHRVKNFKDKSLRNCQLLLHLIDSIRPSIVDYSKVPAGDSEEEQIAKINYTISLARKLGCEIIALWEHVNEANARYLSLFIAELEHNLKKHH
jgi:plastin-1